MNDPTREAFRRRFKEESKRTVSWKGQALIKAVKRWFDGSRPVRIKRENAEVICRVLKVGHLSGLFVLPESKLNSPPYYALAERLSRDFDKLSKHLPRTAAPVLDLAAFDALLNYANWRSALLRRSDGVVAVKRKKNPPATSKIARLEMNDAIVEANGEGTQLTRRADDFASDLFGVLSTLLADAQKHPPRKEQWAELVGILARLRDVLQAPAAPVRVQPGGGEAVAKIKREVRENGGLLLGEAQAVPNG
jgi:hypothetical protein